MKRKPQPTLNDRNVYGYIKKQITLGQRGGYSLETDRDLAPPLPSDSPIITEMYQPFTLRGFETKRMPLPVGAVDLSRVVPGTDVHNIPLKFPGTEHRIPEELRPLEQSLRLCASVEEAINPRIEEFFVYLSLQKSWVDEGEFHRTDIVHSDGLQGPRIQPKVPPEHGYLACDREPTVFFPHAIDLGEADIDVHDMKPLFNALVREDLAVRFPPGTAILIDSYCLHRSALAETAGDRTFFRLMYSLRHFDRQGNTRNALFEDEYARAGWAYEMRPAPSLEPYPLHECETSARHHE